MLTPRTQPPNLAGLAKVLISGVGLIGASIGLGLRSAGWEVAGWDPDSDAADEAFRRGALDHIAAGPDEPSDLLVLAGPLPAILDSIRAGDVDALVTDVAGVKTPVVAAAKRLRRFIGGHPMAGGASSGPSLASSHIFKGAKWILTAEGADADDLALVENMVTDLGAIPVHMTATQHDHAVARVSHLPHLIASALLELARDGAESLAGGGFRDLTRVAASETAWWPEVLAANSEQVRAAISEIAEVLDRQDALLAAGDTSATKIALERAREVRRSLGEHHVQIQVVLVDRPGELAQVGHALETSGADVRDFQLRHGEHGGGGVLTISVTPSSEDRLRRALLEEGFTVEAGS